MAWRPKYGGARQNELCKVAIDELAHEDCRHIAQAARAAAHACKHAPQRLLNHFSDTEQIKRINCGFGGLGRARRRGKKRRR